MKKILMLIIGSVVALPALCQFPDTASMSRVWVPIAFEKTYLGLLKIDASKTTDSYLNTGGIIHYQPESASGNTAPNTMVRVLTRQVAMNADITAQDIVLLDKFIAEIMKPGTYVPPATGEPSPIVLREHVNDQNTPIVYDLGWQKIPANPAAAWLDKFYQKDATLMMTTGVWASYPFRGRRVELIGEKCDNHGKAKVEILKGTTVIKSETVDMYQQTFDAAGNPATLTNWCPAGVVTAIFSSGDLPLDDYVIRWKFDSNDLTKVPRRDSMVVDGIKIYE